MVGGDAERPVEAYPHGRALLEAMAGLELRPARLGVPAYPEGHPKLTEAALQRDLEAKAALADYAGTQLCFEATPLLAWRARQQRLGLPLPVLAGLHLFTFNRVAATRRWLEEYQHLMGDRPAADEPQAPLVASAGDPWPDRLERRHSVTAGQEM